MTTHFVLRVCGDGIAPHPFILGPGEFLVGRDLTCDLVLKDRAVSRFHVRINVNGPIVTITDLDSTNGTCVNGEVVRTRHVLPGDHLTLGPVTLRMLFPDEAANECDPLAATDKSPEQKEPPGLSPARRRVFDLVLRGWTNRAIATFLHRSYDTIRNHVAKILRAAGVPSRARLIAKYGGRKGDADTATKEWVPDHRDVG